MEQEAKRVIEITERNWGYAMGRNVVIDLIGKRYGKLEVIERDIDRCDSASIHWLCRCDCGTIKSVRGDSLRAGLRVSCGCRHGSFKHGKNRTKIHSIWQNMKRRCNEPSNPAYHNYGGRGIRVCERWEVFENFYSDMGDPPPGMSLDRHPDKNGNYEPGNCRWATPTEQSRNTRVNHLIEIDGQTKTLAEWCEIHGQPYDRVRRRISKGWPAKLAIETSKFGITRIEKALGDPVTVRQWFGR